MTGLMIVIIIAFVGGSYIIFRILEDKNREGP